MAQTVTISVEHFIALDNIRQESTKLMKNIGKAMDKKVEIDLKPNCLALTDALIEYKNLK